MINKPSVEELTKDGLNRYELVIATAKCAHLITDEYVEQRTYAEKLIERKETDKPISALIDKDIRDEKAVKNAVARLHAGLYKVVHPGEEGYLDEAALEAEREVEREEADADVNANAADPDNN